MARPLPVPSFRYLTPPGPISEEVREAFTDFFSDRGRALRKIDRGQISIQDATDFWELSEDPVAREALGRFLIVKERLREIEDERDDLTNEKRSLKGR